MRNIRWLKKALAVAGVMILFPKRDGLFDVAAKVAA